MLRALSGNDPGPALAGATPYLRLFGLARGGTLLAEMALADSAGHPAAGQARVALSRFFAENLAAEAPGLEQAILAGASLAGDAALALAS